MDAKKAVKLLSEEREVIGNKSYKMLGLSEARELADFIEQQEHLAKLGAARRWIPVSERLPEKEATVLVWVGKDCVRACLGKTPYGIAWYFVDNHCYVNMHTISHWMPLPEPPEVD